MPTSSTALRVRQPWLRTSSGELPGPMKPGFLTTIPIRANRRNYGAAAATGNR